MRDTGQKFFSSKISFEGNSYKAICDVLFLFTLRNFLGKNKLYAAPWKQASSFSLQTSAVCDKPCFRTAGGVLIKSIFWNEKMFVRARAPYKLENTY